MNGFTGEYTHAMAYSPASSEIYFIAANNLVAMHTESQKQRFFLGHTDNITAFSFDGVMLSQFCMNGSSSRCALSLLHGLGL